VRGVVEQGDLRRRRTQKLGQRVVDRRDLIGCFFGGLVPTDLRFAVEVVGHGGESLRAQQRGARIVQVIPMCTSRRHCALRVDVDHRRDITVVP
jgi:hypothetical protein